MVVIVSVWTVAEECHLELHVDRVYNTIELPIFFYESAAKISMSTRNLEFRLRSVLICITAQCGHIP